MRCRLCGEERNLVKAHIAPVFLNAYRMCFQSTLWFLVLSSHPAPSLVQDSRLQEDGTLLFQQNEEAAIGYRKEITSNLPGR
jgi:hypothetical protein